MRYRRLGGTGLKVSVVGVGTWQFGGEWGKQFSQDEVDALIGRAAELGVNLIDTAECYGDHLAESLVGRAIAGDRERWVIASKFGHRFHPERMRRLWEALQEQVRAGKIRHLGLSIDAGDAARVRAAHDLGAAVVQVPYTVAQLESSVAAAGLDLVSDEHPSAVVR